MITHMRVNARVFYVRVWQDERGWSAANDLYQLSCDGGESEDEAVNHIIGSVYAALAHKEKPPHAVTFLVRRDSGDKPTS